MAAPSVDEFDTWLSQKLQNINPDVDLEVFVQYIRGILETETSRDDKVESILGLIEEITEDGVQDHSENIVRHWENSEENSLKEKQEKEENEKKLLDQKLASIMEKQTLATIEVKEVNPEAAAHKAAILARYNEVCDGKEGSDDSDEDEAVAGNGGDPLLAKNVNAKMVSLRERDQRDREKEAADKKKQKDKEDREKQKVKAQDRKDAEKKRTQKGERRR